MVLSSRKNLVYDKLKDNYYCQKGCDFGGLDTESSKAECHCKVQETITVAHFLYPTLIYIQLDIK